VCCSLGPQFTSRRFVLVGYQSAVVLTSIRCLCATRTRKFAFFFDHYIADVWLCLFCLMLLNSSFQKESGVQRSGFDSRHYQIFWVVVTMERDPLSLVSTTEELLGRRSNGSGLENREYGRRYPSRWPRSTLCSQKLALTSPTSGGRSVGIVRSRTLATRFTLKGNCNVRLYRPFYQWYLNIATGIILSTDRNYPQDKETNLKEMDILIWKRFSRQDLTITITILDIIHRPALF
jgi:hypothetical protein